MNIKKRIVVTGLGTINALTKNVSGFTKALQEGVCGIGPLDLFDTREFRTKNGGQIKDFTPRDYIPKEYSLKRMSRADQLSFAATLEALRDAGLYPVPAQLKEETGVAIGGGSGGLFEAENFYSNLLKKGSCRSRFSALSTVYCASSADRIASAFGFAGPKTTFMTACSAGATALGYARRFDCERSGVDNAGRWRGTNVPDYLCGLQRAKIRGYGCLPSI